MANRFIFRTSVCGSSIKKLSCFYYFYNSPHCRSLQQIRYYYFIPPEFTTKNSVFHNAAKFSLPKKTSPLYPARSNSVVSQEPVDALHTSKTFHELIALRRKQAQKSILIEVENRSHYPKVHEFCEKFGKVINIFHYHLDSREFLLVELNSHSAIDAILHECSYPDDADSIPVQSRLLQYFDSNPSVDTVSNIGLDSFEIPSEESTYRNILKCPNIDAQMVELYKWEKLSELGSRLRFFICSQVEDAINSIFPHCCSFPFGSSINGFGKHNCDLDIYLELTKIKENTEESVYFQVKHSLTNKRGRIQRTLETLGDFFQHFVPGMTQIQRILRATVPILKFQHNIVGVECDLSVSNRSGVYMSELLYLYGELDWRIRPLVFTIRKWAKENHITNIFPGRWITNFSLILMVVFFLQNRPVPLIPTLSGLAKLSGKSDIRKAEGISSCLHKFSHSVHCDNKENLGTLLREFFLYYERFDFRHKGLSIVSGQSYVKPITCGLMIQNPLDQELNVSKNVDVEEVERFCEAARNAVWLLEMNGLHDESQHWGILKLFESPIKSAKEKNAKPFQVKELFKKSLWVLPEDIKIGTNETNHSVEVPTKLEMVRAGKTYNFILDSKIQSNKQNVTQSGKFNQVNNAKRKETKKQTRNVPKNKGF